MHAALHDYVSQKKNEKFRTLFLEMLADISIIRLSDTLSWMEWFLSRFQPFWGLSCVFAFSFIYYTNFECIFWHANLTLIIIAYLIWAIKACIIIGYIVLQTPVS